MICPICGEHKPVDEFFSEDYCSDMYDRCRICRYKAQKRNNVERLPEGHITMCQMAEELGIAYNTLKGYIAHEKIPKPHKIGNRYYPDDKWFDAAVLFLKTRNRKPGRFYANKYVKRHDEIIELPEEYKEAEKEYIKESYLRVLYKRAE